MVLSDEMLSQLERIPDFDHALLIFLVFFSVGYIGLMWHLYFYQNDHEEWNSIPTYDKTGISFLLGVWTCFYVMLSMVILGAIFEVIFRLESVFNTPSVANQLGLSAIVLAGAVWYLWYGSCLCGSSVKGTKLLCPGGGIFLFS